MPLNYYQNSKRAKCVFNIALVLLTLAVSWNCQADDRTAVAHFRKSVQPILERYCFSCHGNGASEGGRKLDAFANDAAIAGNTDLWHAVLKNVRANIMPPASEERPTAEERRQLFDWIELESFGIDPANIDPGRATLRRLNRAEYRNTIRDLLGVDYNTGEQFPPDDAGYGFDNIGDVLSMSPLLMEKYLAAAEAIVAQALPGAAAVSPDSKEADAKQGGQRRNRERYDRRVFVDGPPPEDADDRDAYLRKILATFAKRAFRRPVDDALVNRLVELAKNSVTEGDESFDTSVARGLAAILASPRFVFRIETIATTNDGGKYPLVDEYALASRLSYFLWSTTPDDELIRLADAGQLRAQLPQQVERMLKDGRNSAFVENFAGQWLRSRDVEQVSIEVLPALDLQDDLDRAERELRQLRGNGRRGGRRRGDAPNQRRGRGTAEQARQSEEKAVAKEDNQQQTGTAENERRAAEQKAAEDRAAAERAEQDRQRQERITALTAERDRLTKIRDSFNGRVRNAMRRETEMTFEYILKNNRSVLELVDSNYTFVNETLAKHYGIEGVQGTQFTRVELPADSPRGGLLTQGTLLAVTSNPTRTSPVKRGQYILENILGTPAPPPPANIPPLEQAVDAIKDHPPTIREAQELHRRDPLCMSCHARMDPLGLALENFNAIGMWRTEQNGRPVDPAGQLLTGEKFDNIGQLKKIIAESHRDDFYRCLAEKMITYALGRGLDYHDERTVDLVVARMEANDGRLSALVSGIVESAPFQRRRNEMGAKQ